MNVSTHNPAFRAKVCRLYRGGKRMHEIARAEHCARATVGKVLHREGVTIRRSTSHRLPMFDIMMMRARGRSMGVVALRLGITTSAVSLRIRNVLGRGDVSALLKLTDAQREIYRAALDEDQLSHPDALKLAMDDGAQWQPRQRSA